MATDEVGQLALRIMPIERLERLWWSPRRRSHYLDYYETSGLRPLIPAWTQSSKKRL